MRERFPRLGAERELQREGREALAEPLTMEALTPETIRGFMDRFCGFGDGLIRSITVTYDGSRDLVIVADAYGDKSEWRRLCIQLRGVTEYRLENTGNAAVEVLSLGMHICWFGEFIIGLELGDLADEPGSIQELRTSKSYAIGGWLSWEFVPVA